MANDTSTCGPDTATNSNPHKRTYDETLSTITTTTTTTTTNPVNSESDSDSYLDDSLSPRPPPPPPQSTQSIQPPTTDNSNNVDLMQMMLMIRNQSQPPTIDEPLVRTCSSSSTASVCSSISSATELNANAMSETTLKQFIMSLSSANPASSSNLFDQFAYMVRSRSSSLSDSSSTTSSSSSSSSSNDLLNNPMTASLMKQMLNSYQASINPTTPTTNTTNTTTTTAAAAAQLTNHNNPQSPSAKSQIGQASSLLNNCNLVEPSHPPSTPTTTQLPACGLSDELIKAKLSAVSTVKKEHQQQQQPGSQVSPNHQSPCKVCGDEASGFHYGVDSCEGCKGFFRRCITQGMNHQCTNQQQCEITPFSRNSCQFCRLKKCFAVGMSREASRLGRRPKRPKDDKTNNEMTAITVSGNTTLASPATTPLKPAVEPTKQQPAASPFNLKKTPTDNLVRANSIPQPPFQLHSDAPRPAEPPARHRDTQQKDHKEQMQQIEMLTKLIVISDRHTSIERTNELEFIRTSIIEAHCQIWPTTFEKIRHRYLERPPTRATNNFNARGGSSSHEVIWDTFVDAMVPLIMDVVKYCKYIPGFNQILQHDQVQLLKQGSFEVICVNSFMLVDAQNRLMLTPDMEYLMDSTTIKTMPLGFFMAEVFELGIQVSPLKLSDAEIALFNALLVMNPDRGDLQDKDHVEELQATLLHVLYKHLKYYRSDEPDLFMRLMKLVPIVQEINRKHSEALNTIKMGQGKTQRASPNKGEVNVGQ